MYGKSLIYGIKYFDLLKRFLVCVKIYVYFCKIIGYIVQFCK